MVFKEHFDVALKKLNDYKFKQRNPIKERYSPSDLGMNCKRFLFFGFVNAPFDDNFTDDTNRTLEIGNRIHSMFQEIMKKWDGKTHIKSEHYFQVPLTKDDPNIIFSGSIDDIHMYPNVGMVIVEYKSINGFAIKYLNGKPKPEHIAQIQMYMHYTGIQKGVVVYINKNTSEIEEYRLKYDKEEAMKWIEFIKDTQYNYVDKLELPPIPDDGCHNKSSFPCSYCKYKKICYENLDWKSEYYKEKLKELRDTNEKKKEQEKEITFDEPDLVSMTPEDIEVDVKSQIQKDDDDDNPFDEPRVMSSNEMIDNGLL